MSSVAVPILSSSLAEAIEEHAFSETGKEVGGVLIGSLTEEGVEISGVIPALRAEGAATHVTFTHEVWADVMDTIDDDFPGEQMVGWYHTHPSFGLFLSEYDLFIHRNFFSDARMVALVIDPVAGELGWFGHSEEDIVEISRETTRREPVRHEALARETAVRKRSNLRTVTSAAVGLILVVGVVGFIWGRSSAPDASVPERSAGTAVTGQDTMDDQRATIVLQEQQIRALQDELSALEAPTTDSRDSTDTKAWPPTVEVAASVQAGDSWWSLAERYLGDGSRYRQIMRANPDVEVLHPAATVVIPGVRIAGE